MKKEFQKPCFSDVVKVLLFTGGDEYRSVALKHVHLKVEVF